MKKLIALIVLMGGLAVTAQAETKALIVNGSNQTETLEIKEGQIATVLFWGLSDISGFANVGYLEINIAGKKIEFSRNSYTGAIYDNDARVSAHSNTNFLPVVPGPATIKLMRKGVDSMLTVKIEDDSGTGNGNNVTVIPETADDSTLVLEGSDDMVNWTTETLGEKPKANRKKFYRLRAKKE